MSTMSSEEDNTKTKRYIKTVSKVFFAGIVSTTLLGTAKNSILDRALGSSKGRSGGIASAATIIGGMSQKLTRKAAAEFSFFLAVPTMFAATVKSMWDEKELLIESSNNEWVILLMGNVIAFIVAYFAIKSFISFLNKVS